MWKMSTVDAVAQQKWEDYTEYKSKMFLRTSTPSSPWVVINGNHKDTARKEAMRYVISRMDYPKKGTAAMQVEPDPDIIQVLHNREDADRYLSTHRNH